MNKTARAVVYTILLCIGFSLSAISSAQQLDSDQVKIAYLYNFLKHVRWPDQNQKSSLVVAIYDDVDFLEMVKNSIKNRQVSGKSISVIGVKTGSSARAADLLYIPFQHVKRVSQLASELRRSATLLVTDRSINKHDVMINLVYNKDTTAISFEVNKSNIVYEQLAMSAELLLLGGTELDVATLYRETELAMQAIKKREIELTQQLSDKELLLNESSKRLTQLNNDLRRSTQQIHKQRISLETLEDDIKLQREALADKEKQLSMVASLLDDAEHTLVEQQTAVAAKEIENQQMAQKIVENKEILQRQTENLALQDQELFQRKEKISSQQTTIFLTTVIVVIVFIFLILVIILFVKNRRTTTKLSQTLEDLEQTQGQLVQSEKMASLGTLTAGVAHEINTPLGIIVTSISLMREKTNEIKQNFESGSLKKSTMSAYFGSIEKSSDMSTKALDRVITLLNNFKQVAADQVVEEARELNIVHYIDEVMDTLSAEIKRKHIDYQYAGMSKMYITTIPGIFAQILTNLVTNAISHGFENKENGVIKIVVNQLNNGGVAIEFSDDGCGMTQDVIDKIFDPFFTTKRNHGGTGLGMNIVYNLITTKLGGGISIKSTEGEGTTITITLPQSIRS